jgi:hypothetical protein
LNPLPLRRHSRLDFLQSGWEVHVQQASLDGIAHHGEVSGAKEPGRQEVLSEVQLVKTIAVQLRPVEKGVSLPALPSPCFIADNDHVGRRHQANGASLAVWEDQGELRSLRLKAELCEVIPREPAASVLD